MTFFGTDEESATVKAEQLEPGVRISGDRFDRTSTLVVQDVVPLPAEGKVRVDAADFTSGDHCTGSWYSDRPITCWGRL